MIDQDTLGLLTDHVMKTMERDSIDPDVAIGELGFDSMRVVELIMICDQIYGTPIDPDSLDLTQYTTLRDIDSQFRALALQSGEPKR
jgi:acyl carrier protein